MNMQVYVLGCSIAVVHRPSLQVPPEDEDVTAQRGGIQMVTRVSAFNSTSPMGCEAVESPPDWLLDQLAATLRDRLHLQLFNFDLVRPTEHNAPGKPLTAVHVGVGDCVKGFCRCFMQFKFVSNALVSERS